ncbi:MAG: DUF4373 domain protein [Caudoviricetes sp.]|nr:MAG: DUF4373 domain protein [Caudoviricetes sp.]
MGRQKKAGLSYFPLDTAFFEDRRIRRLTSRFGSDGPTFYLYVLCRAYSNGYCVAVDDDFLDDAALDLNCSAEKIGLMLHYLLDKSLLDSTLFNTVKVLSSHGIQTQYQAIKKTLKRDVEVDGSSWILDESETEGFIKVRLYGDKSEKNKNKSGRNGDKSDINAIKEKESKVNTPPTPSRGARVGEIPKYQPGWFDRFWALYPRHTARKNAVRAWDKLKPDRELCDVMAAAIRAQMETEQWKDPQHIPHPSTWLNGARWLDEVKEVKYDEFPEL